MIHTCIILEACGTMFKGDKIEGPILCMCS